MNKNISLSSSSNIFEKNALGAAESSQHTEVPGGSTSDTHPPPPFVVLPPQFSSYIEGMGAAALNNASSLGLIEGGNFMMIEEKDGGSGGVVDGVGTIIPSSSCSLFSNDSIKNEWPYEETSEQQISQHLVAGLANNRTNVKNEVQIEINGPGNDLDLVVKDNGNNVQTNSEFFHSSPSNSSVSENHTQNLTPKPSNSLQTKNVAKRLRVAISKNRQKSVSGDMLLPITNISRIMKSSLPSNAKVTKESKEMVQESVTEFIQFLTSRASSRCASERRKIINGDDIIWSMKELGYNGYIELYSKFLRRWRDSPSKVGAYEWNGIHNISQAEELSSLAATVSNSPSPTIASSEQSVSLPHLGNFTFSQQQLLPQSYSLTSTPRVTPHSTSAPVAYGRFPTPDRNSLVGGGVPYSNSLYMGCPTPGQSPMSFRQHPGFSPSMNGGYQPHPSFNPIGGGGPCPGGSSNVASSRSTAESFSPGGSMCSYYLPTHQQISQNNLGSSTSYVNMDYVVDDRTRMRYAVKRGGGGGNGGEGSNSYPPLLIVGGPHQHMPSGGGGGGMNRLHVESLRAGNCGHGGGTVGRIISSINGEVPTSGGLTSQSSNMVHAGNMRLSPGVKPMMNKEGGGGYG